jgi:hypothetical protein
VTGDLTTSDDGVLERTADGGVNLELPVHLEHTAPGSSMRWELEAADTGCILRLSQVVPDVQDAVDGCYLVGLQTSLARLEPSLAGRPRPWDWDGFAAAQAHYAGLAAPVDAS